MSRIFHHAAEGVSEAGGDEEDHQHLNEVGERRWIFERMRGVGVEEAAAVSSDHLDGFLRSDWTLRNGLHRAFESLDDGVRFEILDHTLRAKKERAEDGER